MVWGWVAEHKNVKLLYRDSNWKPSNLLEKMLHVYIREPQDEDINMNHIQDCEPTPTLAHVLIFFAQPKAPEGSSSSGAPRPKGREPTWAKQSSRKSHKPPSPHQPTINNPLDINHFGISENATSQHPMPKCTTISGNTSFFSLSKSHDSAEPQSTMASTPSFLRKLLLTPHPGLSPCARGPANNRQRKSQQPDTRSSTDQPFLEIPDPYLHQTSWLCYTQEKNIMRASRRALTRIQNSSSSASRLGLSKARQAADAPKKPKISFLSKDP